MASAAPRDPQTDPRRDPRVEADVRPLVAMPAKGLPGWVIAAGFALLAVVLFVILDGRRRAAYAPPVRARSDDGVTARQAPPLFIPPAPVAVPVAAPTPAPLPPPRPERPPVFTPPPQPRIVYVPQAAPPVQQAPPAPVTSNDPVLVIDTGVGVAPPASTPDSGLGATGIAFAPARASVLRNRRTTVSQGTLIPAVLESALDSTRAGPVRAVVSRDVRGFDGSTVLVPRGSRLFGDYRADLRPGQNRALVTWTRLVRPDGATIALGSPASDPLGRAGIRGKVDSHFLERFGAAILQSALDIGVGYGSRLGTNNSSVIVALPNTAQTLSQPLTENSRQIQPTLRVRQGTVISVFVARDLDFTAVEAGR